VDLLSILSHAYGTGRIRCPLFRPQFARDLRALLGFSFFEAGSSVLLEMLGITIVYGRQPRQVIAAEDTEPAADWVATTSNRFVSAVHDQ